MMRAPEPRNAGLGRCAAQVRFAAVALMLGLVVTLAVAQRALDAGLGSSRVNAPVQAGHMSKPIYTVNRTTGAMQYNRANAFNDRAYRPYQRYTHDRFEYFDVGSSGAQASRPPTAYGNALSHPAYSKSIYGAAPPSSVSHSRRSSSGLAAPTYRIGVGGVDQRLKY